MSAPIEPIAPEAYRGLAGEYVRAVSRTSEAPDVFHLSAALAILGLLFADLRLEEGTYEIHPTPYVVNVGPTGSGKSTANTTARRFLLDPIDDSIPKIEATGSAQGIIESLIREPKIRRPIEAAGELAKARERGLVPTEEEARGGLVYGVGMPTLCLAPEFTSLLKNAGRSTTSDLIEVFLKLFDRAPEIRNETRNAPLLLVGGRIVLLGDSTEEGLADVLGSAQRENGFLNRFSLFRGEYEGVPLPRPPLPDLATLEEIRQEVRARLGEIDSKARVTMSRAAEDWHADLYTSTLFERKRDPDLRGAVVREDSHLKRFAMLTAALRGSTVIEVEDLETAWAIVRYTSESALSLSTKAATGRRGNALEYVEARIRDRGPFASVGYLNREITKTQRPAIDELGGLAVLVAQLIRDGRVLQDETGIRHVDHEVEAEVEEDAA